MSEELEADNTDELIEAMKEGFAARLADVEAKAERYRLALSECLQILDNQHLFRTHGDVQLWLRKSITEALK